MTLAGSIGIFAGVLSFIGFLPYWWAIWLGQTRPDRATWWIWSVVGITIAIYSLLWLGGASRRRSI